MEDDMEQMIVVKASSQKMQYRRRLAVICPACGRRVCDISPHSKMEPFTEDDEEKPPWEADVYVKCSGCKIELSLYRTNEYH